MLSSRGISGNLPSQAESGVFPPRPVRRLWSAAPHVHTTRHGYAVPTMQRERQRDREMGVLAAGGSASAHAAAAGSAVEPGQACAWIRTYEAPQ
eukprot:COSAG03_NODE_609_length_6710_cov_20.243023_7_plen_94_part_00